MTYRDSDVYRQPDDEPPEPEPWQTPDYGTCDVCGSKRVRRESPTGGWYTECPTCPPGLPALPDPKE